MRKKVSRREVLKSSAQLAGGLVLAQMLSQVLTACGTQNSELPFNGFQAFYYQDDYYQCDYYHNGYYLDGYCRKAKSETESV